MAVEQTRTTLEEFEAFIALPENRERRFELVHGEIVEKGTTEECGVIMVLVGAPLLDFSRSNDLGRVAVRPYHRPRADDFNSRLPDVAFTSKARALPVTRSGAVPQMPDLVVEVKSPDDTYRLMLDKASYYLENGVRMVWLIFPEKQIVEMYQPDQDIQILTPGDTISGSDVLPGFELPVREVFNYD